MGDKQMDATGIDSLTGFLDRQGCLRAVTRLAEHAQRDSRPLTALWLNLDRFTKVNESFGLAGGDTVIAKTAERLRNKVRNRAHLARMGSDEFVLLVADSDSEDGQLFASEVLQLVRQPLELGAMRLYPTGSVGLAVLDYGESPVELIERAHRAMQEAKRQGGNRFVVSGEEQQPGRLGVLLAREELEVEGKLHRALEIGGLYLQYQPIIDMDGQVACFEALMRCEIDGELISPVKFIPVAEKTGLVVRLGEWSLMQAARQAKYLQDEGHDITVAVNVSRVQLTAPKFAQALHAVFLCTDVSPKSIELEITESLFMDVSELVQFNLRAALSAGVKLVIDDFGTGYSCLATLKDIPAHKLKIDRAFVIALPHDKRVFSVVKAITQLGRELGMTIVAEGVETEEQLDALRLAGVDLIQGFYYSKPIHSNKMLGWLERGHA